MSVPIPSGEALKAMRAHSPPDEPPGERPLWSGFRVSPQTLLLVSIIIIAVGTFVLT